MTLYMVSSGQYSDYRIQGIFSSKELAEKHKVFRNSDNPIEEWEMDDENSFDLTRLGWRVEMYKDGSTKSVRRDDSDPYGSPHFGTPTTETHFSITDPGRHLWNFFVHARDEHHAVKIANERRALLLANNLWDVAWNKETVKDVYSLWEGRGEQSE